MRRIAGHDPDSLSYIEYGRQYFWGTGMDLPDELEQRFDEFMIEALELPPGEKALLSIQLPAEFTIVFDPVSHTTQFIDVKGEPTKERQTLSVVFNDIKAQTGTVEMRPGPLRITFEAVPHRQAAFDQPDVPRHLPHRHHGRRSAHEDHEPDVPVHRPQGLDRAL